MLSPQRRTSTQNADGLSGKSSSTALTLLDTQSPITTLRRGLAPLTHPYVVVRGKKSEDLQHFKIGGFYVGLQRELPPPAIIWKDWNTTVRPDIEEHLRLATLQLPPSMDLSYALELCMAGKKCSPKDLPKGIICPRDPVMLKPTVWIECGSKKWRKKVRLLTPQINTLGPFLGRYYLDPAHVSLQGPYATARASERSYSLCDIMNKITFEVQWPKGNLRTACGLTVRFTIREPTRVIEKYSTVGGLIWVDGTLFGLTSAHGIASYIFEALRSEASIDAGDSDDSSSIISSSSDASSGSSSVSDSEPGSDNRPGFSQHAPPISSRKGKEPQIAKPDDYIWMELPRPRTLAYMGRGTMVGNYSFPDVAPKCADFALVDFRSLPTMSNVVLDPKRQENVTIADYIPTHDLVEGEVWIVGSRGDTMKGYLLRGDASLILRGTVMRTKKIQVERAGAAGLSGAWVIRDGKLCGSVYAAYDKSPYLHMLPAEGTFLDIFSMLPVSAARVATSVDCTAVRVPSSKGYVSDLNSHVLESDSGESARPQPLWAPSRRQPDTCPSCGRTVGNEWEWQPGPNGPNTLCTSCGLDYAGKMDHKRVLGTVFANLYIKTDPQPQPPLPSSPMGTHSPKVSDIPSSSAPKRGFSTPPHFSSSQTTSAQSSNSNSGAHWATKIFDGRHTITPFQGVVNDQATCCLGKDEPHAIELLEKDGFQKVLEIPLEATNVWIRLYWRSADNRARILFLTLNQYGSRRRYCVPLTSLTVRRTGSCLQLAHVNRTDGILDLWANLRFASYERMVLFYCTLVAMRHQDEYPTVQDLPEGAFGPFLLGEVQKFTGYLSENSTTYWFRMICDQDSSGVRFEVAELGIVGHVPLWTAFVTQYIGENGWMEDMGHGSVQFRELHPYVFDQEYVVPKGPTGKYTVTFTSQADATRLMETFHGSRQEDDGARNHGSNLFVTGIHPSLTEEEVTRLFEKYGEVEKCNIMRDPHSKDSRGYGFVKMVTSEQADAAKEGLQGEVYQGRTLSIEKARRARPRTPNPPRFANEGQTHEDIQRTEPQDQQTPHPNLTKKTLMRPDTMRDYDWVALGGPPQKLGGPPHSDTYAHGRNP